MWSYCTSVQKIGSFQWFLKKNQSIMQFCMHIRCLLRNIHKIPSSGPIWLIFCMWQYFMSSRGVMAFSEVYRLCMHACMHMHAYSIGLWKCQNPPGTHEILPHAKNQPNWTTRRDFMNIFLLFWWGKVEKLNPPINKNKKWVCHGWTYEHTWH